MTPNLPKAALPVFGPDVTPDGRWGGVPWMHGVTHPEKLEGMRDHTVTLFPYAQANAVLAVTDSDNDLDGPPRALGMADPCYEPDTALRYPGGVSCDSRRFPGVVISPVLKALGVRLGDFCLVSWNGAIRSAQVYDISPTRLAGENSLYLNRQLGIVPAGKTDHWAALTGHDTQDVCTLIFAGSGPGHALPLEEIIDGAHACWARFTSRATSPAPLTPVAVAKAAPATGTSGTAAGSVGVAVPLLLAAVTTLSPFVPLFAAAPPPELGSWLGCASFVMAAVLTALHIRRELRPDPPFDKKYATKEELGTLDKASLKRAGDNEARITRLEAHQEAQHKTNVAHLGKLEEKLDRNFNATVERQDDLVREIRHDVRQELQAAELKAEARNEKAFDRLTDIVRGLGRVEGGRSA